MPVLTRLCVSASVLYVMNRRLCRINGKTVAVVQQEQQDLAGHTSHTSHDDACIAYCRRPSQSRMRTFRFDVLPPALLVLTLSVVAKDSPEVRYGLATRREAGRCSMYDACGRKGGIFGQELPCADNGLARPVQSFA